MRKILSSLVMALVAISSQAQHQTLAERGIKVSDVNVVKSDSTLFVTMDVDASGVKVRTNQKILLKPILMGQGVSKELPPINLSGRNSYLRTLRNEKDPDVLSTVYRQKRKKAQIIEYQVNIPYESWMRTSELMIEDSRCGCLDKVLGEKQEEALAKVDFAPKDFLPHYLFLTPAVEDKERQASGRAFIDFPVNETKVYPKYRNNSTELQKIYSTIDSVRNTPDAVITAFSIKGYASPEGPYEGNDKLAKGRTASLLHHIQTLFSLPEEISTMDSEPEDWAGLRKFVAQSGLAQKEAILAIIDSDLEPDAKNWKIHADYPVVYRYLLDNVYPALRHSDYTVYYTVKSYTDLDEAKRVLKERPGNLSLHELQMIALSYEEGSPEYEEVFDIMVRVYPEDEIANLNAANVSMKRGDLVSAEKFLTKAGDAPEALYARGNLLALKKDFEAATALFQQAKEAGLEEAADALQQIDTLLN